MKRIKLSLIALSGLLASGGWAIAQEGSASVENKPTLQVEVTVPPSSDMLYERDVSEALTARVRDAFRRRGYEGRVQETLRGDKPGQPVLAVNLVRWRMDRAGFIECSFTASVRHPDGAEVPLGVFTASEVSMGGSRWGLADSFERAAEDAADQLWVKLQKSDALPTVTQAVAS